MAVFRREWVLLALSSVVLSAVRVLPAHADDRGMCRVINVDFTPGGIQAGAQGPQIDPQIVAWIEKPSGQFVKTVFITQQTGHYGLGNRPGRFDFNSGPNWPYGRRITVFPVWANRHGVAFPQLEFQGGTDSDLSHQAGQSSHELHFCRPLDKAEPQWDAATCSSAVYTDKGTIVDGGAVSHYPPRADVIPVTGMDSPSVEMYRAMNPFDAISQATPRLGVATELSWPIPADLVMGDYVMFLEVSLEQDFNATYSAAKYPSPNVAYGSYGVPYRGQPSVVYRVPFTVSNTETIATTDAYIGYGDPDGGATLHPPDATITSDTPNLGALRLLMTSKDGQTFRVRVDARPEQDFVPPSAPGTMIVSDPQSGGATLQFLAPGDDGDSGVVKGYEVRYLVGDVPITDVNFAAANEVTFAATIAPAGMMQDLSLKDLLPETQYTVAVRAFDDCHNTGPITTATFTTAPRKIGEVGACFIATAAYGSVLANDVEMLRRFRDTLLKHSVLGELAVETYYTFGPTVAGVVGESDLLRATARDLLAPVVDRVRGLRW
jgi:fibronectin type III domain protein